MDKPQHSNPSAPVLDAMVNRFLCWKLPDDFAPDGGVSFVPWPHQLPGNLHWPVGTNLLTAVQARAMFESCLAGAALSGVSVPPSVSPAVEGGDSPEALEAWLRNFAREALNDEAQQLYAAANLIRRLATPEQPGSGVSPQMHDASAMSPMMQPGSAVQGEAVACMCCGAPCTLGSQMVRPFPGEEGEPEEVETYTYAPPSMPAPAAEQGDAVTKALDTLTQYSAEHGHPADFERAITTLSVLAKSTATQPAARGVEGMVPRSDLDDLYRAYVRLLETGRDRIMDLGGACDPVDMMERNDPFLVRARRALAAAPSGVRVDEAMALRLLDWQPLACNNRGDRLWQLLESAGLPHDQQIAALTAALAGKERA